MAARVATVCPRTSGQVCRVQVAPTDKKEVRCGPMRYLETPMETGTSSGITRIKTKEVPVEELAANGEL